MDQTDLPTHRHHTYSITASPGTTLHHYSSSRLWLGAVEGVQQQRRHAVAGGGRLWLWEAEGRGGARHTTPQLTPANVGQIPAQRINQGLPAAAHHHHTQVRPSGRLPITQVHPLALKVAWLAQGRPTRQHEHSSAGPRLRGAPREEATSPHDLPPAPQPSPPFLTI